MHKLTIENIKDALAYLGLNFEEGMEAHVLKRDNTIMRTWENTKI